MEMIASRCFLEFNGENCALLVFRVGFAGDLIGAVSHVSLNDGLLAHKTPEDGRTICWCRCF